MKTTRPSPRQSHNQMPYLPALDGLRALAVLGVLVFHASPLTLSGGFAGVDVFFVLSGFLITSLITHDLERGVFSPKEFYLRRVQRLLPNALAVLAATLALWWLFMPPGWVQPLARQGVPTLLSYANMYIFNKHGDYWGEVASSSPLTHFWSLGVEEQFYLLWPLTVALLFKFQRRRLAAWTLALGAASFALCLWFSHTERAAAAFYLPHLRGWELLAGAALALVKLPRANFAGVIGLALTVTGFVIIKPAWIFPGAAALLPVLGAAGVIAAVADGQRNFTAKILSAPLLVGIGKISYSLYLWHWPLIIFCKQQAQLRDWPPAAVSWAAVAGGAAGLALSVAAYYFIERPLRRRGAGRQRRLLVIAGAFALMLAACITVKNLRLDLVSGGHYDTAVASMRLYDMFNKHSRQAAARAAADGVATQLPPDAGGERDGWLPPPVARLYGGGTPRVVVLGSSHAEMYSPVIDRICREHGVSVAFVCGAGVRVLFTGGPVRKHAVINSPRRAAEFDAARRQWLEQWRPAAVFLIDRWDAHYQADGGASFERDLRATLAVTAPPAGRVIWVAQAPAVALEGGMLASRLEWRAGRQLPPPRLQPDNRESLRRFTVSVAEQMDAPNFYILRPDRLFYQADGAVRYHEGRKIFYNDGDHLTDAGAEEAHALFEQAITAALAADDEQPRGEKP